MARFGFLKCSTPGTQVEEIIRQIPRALDEILADL